MTEMLGTEIPEVFLLKAHAFRDERGFFMETYNKLKAAESSITAEFVQDNHSRSKRGVLRGLHYQVKHPQGKLVRVVSGEIFDVAVDLRRSSPYFGKWVGLTLAANEFTQVWIPVGFAHGFYTLSEYAEVIYKTTDYYAPEWERTLMWNDAQLGIQWPIEAGAAPLLSAKDAAGSLLKDAEVFD